MFQPHKMSDFLILKKLVSTRNHVLRTSPVIPYWWCISITTQTWVVIRHHYGISALVSQKQTNKQTNEQTKTRKKKQLNWKKKKKWETSRDVASFSAQANRDFKIQRRGRRRERQKNNRFYKQNNSFARASHFFCTFLSRFCTTTTWKCLISCLWRT